MNNSASGETITSNNNMTSTTCQTPPANDTTIDQLLPMTQGQLFEQGHLSAAMIPTGIGLYVLSLLTFVGNAMVLHAIRTEKRLQTVRLSLFKKGA